LTGRFWNGAIQNYWNEIAQTAALSHGLTTAQSARLFALLNLALADSVIAFYDAKYAYNFWRPVTAIRNATTAGDPKTTADPNWLPEVTNTAADPSYPGAHAVISAAAASVLQSVFGHKPFPFAVTSEVLPGVQRSFDDFAAAAEEASLSRVFAGVHFRTDEAAGERLGRSIGGLVVEDFLRLRD
jgi:membrane-associated phospholipid phosphatase